MPITLRPRKYDGLDSIKKIASRNEGSSATNFHAYPIQRISKEQHIFSNYLKLLKWSKISFRAVFVALFSLLLLQCLYNLRHYNSDETRSRPNHTGVKSLFSTSKSTQILRKRRSPAFPPRRVTLELLYDSLLTKNRFPPPRRLILGKEGKNDSQNKKNAKKRFAYFIRENRSRLGRLKKSDWYDDNARDPLYEITENGQDCVPMHKWQTTSFPSCSIMHELSLGQLMRDDDFGHLTDGGYNSIFWISSSEIDDPLVLKILTYDQDHTDRSFDRVRRDALISERLTSSSYIMNIYGHCGHTMLVPYSPDNLSENLSLKMTKQQRFEHARTVIYALADAHNIDGDGIASITHGDLVLRQFNKIGNNYQLSDFNRGRFLRWDKRGNKTCTYEIGVNDKTVRRKNQVF